jgi:glycosyltransferase involved in cell wall biosynthesis
MWRTMQAVDADIYYQRTASMLTAVVTAFCRWHGKHSIYAGASDSDFVPGRQLVRFRRDRWLFERGLAAAEAIVVQNSAQQRDCLENYGRNSTVIQNCYELPADAHPGADDYVLWVATMRPGKRPELFLDLARRMPHRRFVMVGGAAGSDHVDTAYFDAIAKAAAELANLEFVGFRPLAEVEPLFDRARIVVNTSLVEGMPNVFLQAWARGIPTVAYVDVGARQAGMPIYQVVADTDAAVKEIERLFADEIYRTQASVRCASYFAATHGKTAVLASYMRLLGELVSGEHRG